MSVKNSFTIFNGLNYSYLCFSGAALLLAVSVFVIRVPDKKFQAKQTNLAIRSMGHELLKSNNNFSTPVPPVVKNSSGELLLKFDEPISIHPDSLVMLSLKYLHSGTCEKSIVSVRDIDSEEIVYGFEIDHKNMENIPCLGRVLPESSYIIEVSFDDDQRTRLLYANIPALSTASVSALFILIGFLFFRKSKALSGSNNKIEWNGIRLNIELNRIEAKDERIQLTDKETRILTILFENAGSLVSREFFIEQVWLKEGVVTDRSLDMYISRLRKKLRVLSNIQILNQHGKGYHLRQVDV